MIHLWKAELSRSIKIYTYGYFEVSKYLKCSLVCNHVDSKVNSREILGRESVNNHHQQQFEILRHFPSFQVDKVDMLCHIKGEEMDKCIFSFQNLHRNFGQDSCSNVRNIRKSSFSWCYTRCSKSQRPIIPLPDRAPVAQLIEHRVVMWKVVSSTPAGPTLRVLK